MEFVDEPLRYAIADKLQEMLETVALPSEYVETVQAAINILNDENDEDDDEEDDD